MRINRNIWLPIKHEAERVDFLAYGRQAKKHEYRATQPS